jgi:hypothetical protein
MSLKGDIRFQKTLALAASASNAFEAEAAERAARRLMEQENIDPTDIPNQSLYSAHNFADNPLLQKLRKEYREQHPLPEPVVKKTHATNNFKPSVSIPFSLKEFSKFSKGKLSRAPRLSRDKARIELLRQLLNARTSRSDLYSEHGFTSGEISGVIRDYTGSRSALPYFQKNPKWLVRHQDGRAYYELIEQNGETDDQPSNDSEARRTD